MRTVTHKGNDEEEEYLASSSLLPLSGSRLLLGGLILSLEYLYFLLHTLDEEDESFIFIFVVVEEGEEGTSGGGARVSQRGKSPMGPSSSLQCIKKKERENESVNEGAKNEHMIGEQWYQP
jgi:hypothetical protein